MRPVVTLKSGIQTSDATYNESTGWNLVAGTGSLSGGDTSLEAISKEQSYVGYYANLDEDEEPEGIIYADLAIGGSGQWSNSDGAYSYSAITGTKDYYISEEDYAGTFGTNGEEIRDVITVMPNSEGAERFYVMALEDFTTADYSTFYWYYRAYTNKISDYASKTSNDFGTGKANTANMIEAWNGEDYGTQNARDMWGVIQDKVAEGWFVPSRGEWGAFGNNLGITKSNYSNYGLSYFCWASSLSTNNCAWNASFYDGCMLYNDFRNDNCVRLGATF